MIPETIRDRRDGAGNYRRAIVSDMPVSRISRAMLRLGRGSSLGIIECDYREPLCSAHVSHNAPPYDCGRGNEIAADRPQRWSVAAVYVRTLRCLTSGRGPASRVAHELLRRRVAATAWRAGMRTGYGNGASRRPLRVGIHLRGCVRYRGRLLGKDLAETRVMLRFHQTIYRYRRRDLAIDARAVIYRRCKCSHGGMRGASTSLGTPPNMWGI
jgi:hypothetical protein